MPILLISLSSEDREQEKMTLYAEFHYLLTLKGVLLTTFSVDFHNNEAGPMHKSRNNRDVFL